MNWVLKGRKDTPTPPMRGNVPDGIDQFMGGIKQTLIAQDAWGRRARLQSDLETEIIETLGGPDAIAPRTPGEEERWKRGGAAARRDYLLEKIAEKRAIDPVSVGIVPVNREEWDAAVTRRDLAEEQELAEMMGRGDATLTQMAGRMVGAMVDETSLPLMFFGGSPLKLVRFALTEAGLGAAGEIPAVVKTRARDKRLGRDPGTMGDALGQIATGAAMGGAFGALIGGGARALNYVRERRLGEAEARGDRPGLEHQQDVAAAERALRSGQEPPAGRPALPPVAPDAPANWAAIRGGIFAGESGGDYDALFGYSNREGGPWSNVKLTQMTVDEAIEFSDPAGPYAQWVKARVGRVATPMGAYQIVGRTLREAKAALGLRGDEMMTPELQERLGQHIYRAQGTGAWEGYRGPRADFTPAGSFDPWQGTGASGGAAPGGRRRRITEIDEVTTPAGTRARVQYRVVDLAELKAATGDLQPRDRARAASDEQVADIAARLDPARLMPAAEADRGAPIVGPDMIVESGNGRVMAIGRAAEQHPELYQGYVDAIRAEGFDIPEGVSRPVLIAERTSGLDTAGRRAFIREANTSAIARMAPSEQARLDAGYLTQRVFDAYATGRGLNAPENTEFVRRMLGTMPQAERAALITADGRLNIDGLRRLRQALFSNAFEADDLLRLLAETESPAVENLLRMLEDLAPDWAAFRAMVEAGYIRADFDITSQLMDVTRMIAKARVEGRDGQSVIAAVRDRLAQGNLFGDGNDMAEALIEVFYKGDRARRPDASAEILRRYAAEAAQVGRADTDDLLGAPVAPAEALARAVTNFDRREPFQPAQMPASAAEPPVEPLGDIRGLDPAQFEDGASSPLLDRATARIEADLRGDPAPAARAADASEPAARPVDDSAAPDPAAKDMADALADLRALPDADRIEVTIGEGAAAQTVTLRDFLTDIDADETLIARMTSCALRGVPA